MTIRMLRVTFVMGQKYLVLTTHLINAPKCARVEAHSFFRCNAGQRWSARLACITLLDCQMDFAAFVCVCFLASTEGPAGTKAGEAASIVGNPEDVSSIDAEGLGSPALGQRFRHQMEDL